MILAVVVCLTLTAGQAIGAGPADYGNTATSGSTDFKSGGVDVAVDYAVYNPGEFTGSHVDKATKHIYAYQATNNNNNPISSFNVGLNPGADVANPSSIGNGQPASYWGPSGIVEGAFYFPEGLSYQSQVLLFSSPHTYILGSAVVIGGDASGYFASGRVATPIPEPATIALLGLGTLVFIRRKRSV